MRGYAGYLKQSVATGIKMGPFVDKTDMVTAEAGLASGMDVSSGVAVSKNDGVLAERNGTPTATTYDKWGYYNVFLDTTDTGTLGALAVVYSLDATALPVRQDYSVVPANVFDSLFSTDNLQVDLVQVLGGASGASGLNDFAVAGYNTTTHNVSGVSGVYVVTNLTNAATSGDLTSVMKTSVGTACAAGLASGVTISGDLSATMKTSVESGVKAALISGIITGPVTGSVGFYTQTYLDAAISSRLGPTGVLTTVTNLTNAPTAGDFTSTMKTSLVSGVNSASGMVVASVSGSVGSVVSKTGYQLNSSGLDLISAPTDVTSDAVARATFMGMFRAIFNRFHNKVTQSSTQQIVFNDTATGISTMAVSVAGGVEEKGKSS